MFGARRNLTLTLDSYQPASDCEQWPQQCCRGAISKAPPLGSNKRGSGAICHQVLPWCGSLKFAAGSC